MKTILKWLFCIIGIGIFVFTIVEEIDGIGRFACILFGVIFTFLGTYMSSSRK